MTTVLTIIGFIVALLGLSNVEKWLAGGVS